MNANSWASFPARVTEVKDVRPQLLKERALAVKVALKVESVDCKGGGVLSPNSVFGILSAVAGWRSKAKCTRPKKNGQSPM